MSERKEWLNNFAVINKGKTKDGDEDGSLYIKVIKDVTMKKGDIVHVKSVEEVYEGWVNAGKITVEEAEQKLDDFHWQLYYLTLPPSK